MTTAWIAGRSSNGRPGGVTRPGPPNETGLARCDHWGSVRTFTPSSWTSSVECPTHVTVAAPRLSRSRAPSLTTIGSDTRLRSNDVRHSHAALCFEPKKHTGSTVGRTRQFDPRHVLVGRVHSA